MQVTLEMTMVAEGVRGGTYFVQLNGYRRFEGIRTSALAGKEGYQNGYWRWQC